MITKKYLFSVGTRYVGSEVKEEIEFQFVDNCTLAEMEKEVQAAYEEWVNQNTDQTFMEIE